VDNAQWVTLLIEVGIIALYCALAILGYARRA